MSEPLHRVAGFLLLVLTTAPRATAGAAGFARRPGTGGRGRLELSHLLLERGFRSDGLPSCALRDRGGRERRAALHRADRRRGVLLDTGARALPRAGPGVRLGGRRRARGGGGARPWSVPLRFRVPGVPSAEERWRARAAGEVAGGRGGGAGSGHRRRGGGRARYLGGPGPRVAAVPREAPLRTGRMRGDPGRRSTDAAG